MSVFGIDINLVSLLCFAIGGLGVTFIVIGLLNAIHSDADARIEAQQSNDPPPRQ